jgi:hypothetical protein
MPIRVLFLGASYGAVLGMRIAAAGHRVTFVCRDEEAALINAGKLLLRIPAKEPASIIEINPSHCAIAPDARAPQDIDPSGYDLVCLAMQEPQYGSPGVRELIQKIVQSGTPCLSIMNIPLPPFLQKIVTLDDTSAHAVFTEPGLWNELKSSVFTMASADPQAMRIEADNAIAIAVTLPTNFNVAPFEHSQHQALLERLAQDIDNSRIESNGVRCQPRVRLKPHASRHIPLAKWPMLITGNFRCLTSDEPVSIAEAVCGDEAESREIYDWVLQVCLALGIEEATLVPFDRYLAAAKGLSLSSSLARGLFAGATAVERVDILIQSLAGQQGMNHAELDRIVADVSGRLAANLARK